jgi:hypothetical protein
MIEDVDVAFRSYIETSSARNYVSTRPPMRVRMLTSSERGQDSYAWGWDEALGTSLIDQMTFALFGFVNGNVKHGDGTRVTSNAGVTDNDLRDIRIKSIASGAYFNTTYRVLQPVGTAQLAGHKAALNRIFGSALSEATAGHPRSTGSSARDGAVSRQSVAPESFARQAVHSVSSTVMIRDFAYPESPQHNPWLRENDLLVMLGQRPSLTT